MTPAPVDPAGRWGLGARRRVEAPPRVLAARRVGAALPLVVVALLWAGPASAQPFRRPVACEACVDNWFYVDQVDGPGVGDWSCAASSYAGHRGTDFSLAGGVPAIADGHDVVAAADGVVRSAVDGHFDGCRTCDEAVDPRCGVGAGGGYGNHVVIHHGGATVIYAHLRAGSVGVAPGDAVRCGDVIGQIGSSGCSTGPHLHFEVRDLAAPSDERAYDPFAGRCSPTTPTRWVAQGPPRGMPSARCSAAPPCPWGTAASFVCDADRARRVRCVDGVTDVEPCPFGCAPTASGVDDACAPPPDEDSDGSPADVDCDDRDPARAPGLEEICGDGIDQDCDGEDLGCASPDAGAIDVAERDAGTDATDAGCGCRASGAGTDGPLGLALLALLTLRACAARRTRAASPRRSPRSARRRRRASASTRRAS